GDGRGNFGNNGVFATGVPNPGAIQAADFNGDSFPDIIVSSKSTSLTNAGVAVLMNQLGTGFGSAIQTDVVPGTGLQQVATTDVNQDGFADAIVPTNIPNIGGTATGATGNNPPPIVLNVNTTNGLSVNDSVIITGVQGNTAANGTWVVSAISGGKGGA